MRSRRALLRDAVVAVGAFVLATGCRLRLRGLPKAATEYAPNFYLKDQDGEPTSLEEMLLEGPVVLVFYRGHWSLECREQLVGFMKRSRDFAERHVRVVGISVDHRGESKIFAQEAHLDFTLLEDVDAIAIEGYGVLMAGEKLAIPSVFIVGTDNTVRWRYVSARIDDRPSSAAVLAAVDELAKLESDDARAQ